MNLVDSSCWLEYFAGSGIAETVAEAIEDTANLVVPAITIYEVFKKLLKERGDDAALFAAAHMKQGKTIDLDAELSIFAAKVGIEHKLPLADSIIYATALKFDCLVWTQDKHFENLNKVRYFPKSSSL